MDVGAHSEAAHRFPGAADVVDVPVGNQQGQRHQVVRGEARGNTGDVGRGIDDHCGPTGFGGHHPGVGLGSPQRGTFD